MGRQVMETVLNKNVSTGDDLCGLPWAELPPSLQVYEIGDIQFGYICYNFQAWILLRDLFPDPDRSQPGHADPGALAGQPDQGRQGFARGSDGENDQTR